MKLTIRHLLSSTTWSSSPVIRCLSRNYLQCATYYASLQGYKYGQRMISSLNVTYPLKDHIFDSTLLHQRLYHQNISMICFWKQWFHIYIRIALQSKNQHLCLPYSSYPMTSIASGQPKPSLWMGVSHPRELDEVSKDIFVVSSHVQVPIIPKLNIYTISQGLPSWPTLQTYVLYNIFYQ